MRQYTTLFTALCLWYLPLQAQKKTFVEVSEQAGINHSFQVDLATFGGGACVLDFNNDGFEDIYVTGGAAPDVLYKNNGDGTFTNIHTPESFERTYKSYTQGVAAADINKDGYKDLIVTTMNYLNESRSSAPNLLYLNNGDGTFTDVTEKWGLENFRVNSMAASFGDVNADGYPDLFIANYFSSSAAGISIYNEQTITNSFQPSIDYLFLNTSGQGFVDARAFYGLEHEGFGFQGVFTDYDNDGDLDLYVANDFGYKSSPNLMLRNEYPQKKFVNFANRLALNYGMNAMGIAYCDYNFDGWMDYFVTNLSTSVFSANAKEGKPFIDKTFGLGAGISTIVDSVYTGPPVSWGANFFDFDHDTDMDLFVSNGALNPTIRPNPNLFLVFENGKFVERGKDFDLFDYRIGRGSVVFDYDNDGDLDLFVVNQQPRDPDRTLLPARCLLYRNDAANGNWLKVELVGKTADTHGLGSRIEVVVNGKLLSTEIDGGSSHLSQNSTIAHFGLGNATKVESVTVKWIGGKSQTITDLAVNQKIVIEQAEEKAAGAENNFLEVSPGFFTDRVFIEYELTEAEPLELRVYDVRGQLIEQLASIPNPVAKGVWQWDVARYLPRGVYVFQLRTENATVSKRAVKL